MRGGGYEVIRVIDSRPVSNRTLLPLLPLQLKVVVKISEAPMNAGFSAVMT
jgi:hypothetical protein